MYRQYELEDPQSSTTTETPATSRGTEELSRTQQEKLRKLRRKAKVVVEHVDIIKDDFWTRRPWILSNRPGKLPAA